MNTQLFLAEMPVDLTDVISIPLNKTFEDLVNPSDINNDFSKEIRLLVNIKNNEVLGNAFRIDRSIIVSEGSKNIGKYLNPTKKIPFRLVNNGDVIMEGYAKLSLADYSVEDKYYTINLFGTLGDLFHKLLNVTPNIKFCPELDALTETYSEEHKSFYLYAVPFDKDTDQPITGLINPEHRTRYKWRDIRYLIENKDIKSPMDETSTYTNKNYISGDKYINAKSIKECWETDVDTTIVGDNIDNIKGTPTGDWQIVGFMPSHHGFPDNFDAKSVEDYDPDKNITSNLLFADIAQANNKKFKDDGSKSEGYNVDIYIGDGITEDQFQQFVSWQLKPYIYISKLFQLFQKHMENNPDLFDGYKLELDNVWKTKESDQSNINNPYWTNLIYTFDFLFNLKLEEKLFSVNAVPDNDVIYKHTNFSVDGDHHDVVSLSTKLNIEKSDDEVLKTMTLQGYACVLVPIVMVKRTSTGSLNADGLPYAECANLDAYTDWYSPRMLVTTPYLYGWTYTPSLGYMNPTWYFSTGEQLSVGESRYVCNGNYILNLSVLDKDTDLIVGTYKNVWYNDKDGRNKDGRTTESSPKYTYGDAAKIIPMFKNDTLTDDRMVINRKPIAPVFNNDTNQWEAPADFTYRDNMIWSKKIGTVECPVFYVEVMLPLRSFGAIPIGIKHPELNIEIQLDGHNYYSKGDWHYKLGSVNTSTADLDRRVNAFKVKDLVNFPNSTDGISLSTDRNNVMTDMCFRQSFNTEIAGYYFENSDRTIQLTSSLRATAGQILGQHYYQWKSGANAISGINFTLGDDTKNKVWQKFEAPTSFFHRIINCTCLSSTSHNLKKCTLANLWEKEDSLFNIIIEYSKMLGLYWHIDDKNKKIKLLTKYSYFKDYSIEDWSDRVDYSKEYKVTPILHASKYLNFDYDNIDDGYHYSNYKSLYLTNYGGYRLKTGYEFTPDSEDIFKGLHPSCFSNRSRLTWKQIYDYNPIKGIRSSISPLTLLDCESQDGTTPISLNTWCFRMPSKGTFDNVLSKDDKNVWNAVDENGYYVSIVDATPTMIGADKYSYIGYNDRSIDHYILLGCVEKIYSLPNFCNATGEFGSLFAKPLEDYTISDVDNDTRQEKTDIQKTSVWLYNKFWQDWMEERYNINNKKLTCYVKFTPGMFKNISPLGNVDTPYFANFKIIGNQLYILNKIFDYNINQDYTAKCEFIQITNVEAYANDQTIDFGDVFTLEHKDDTKIDKDAVITVSKYTRQYVPFKNKVDIENYKSPSRDYRFYLPYQYNTTYNTMDYWGWTPSIRLDANRPMFSIYSSGDTYVTIKGGSYTMLKTNNELSDYTSGLAVGNTKTIFIKGGETYSEAIYFMPNFSFFAKDDSITPRQSTLSATNSNGVNKIIYFNLPNIATEYYFTQDQSLNKVDEKGTIITPIDIYPDEYGPEVFNNWNVSNFDAQYVSFYEVPIHIFKRATEYEGAHERVELDLYTNIILPTDNKCVDFLRYEAIINNNPFEQFGNMYVKGNPMFDNENVTDEIIRQIRDRLISINEEYKGAEIHIAIKEGKTLPVRLYTTWIYSLKAFGPDGAELNNGHQNTYNNVSGTSEFDWTIYGRNVFETSSLLNYNKDEQWDNIKNRCYDNIYKFGYTLLEKNNIASFAFDGAISGWRRNWTSDPEDVTYKFFGGRGDEYIWYPDVTTGKDHKLLYGRMTAADLEDTIYLTEQQHIFLVDPDKGNNIIGNDGYIYHTFCQELLPYEPKPNIDMMILDEFKNDLTRFNCHLSDVNTDSVTIFAKIEGVDQYWLSNNSLIIVRVFDNYSRVEVDQETRFGQVIDAVWNGDAIVLTNLRNTTGGSWRIQVEIQVNNSLTSYILPSPCGDQEFTFFIDGITIAG